MRTSIEAAGSLARRVRDLRGELEIPGHPPWVGRAVADASVMLAVLGSGWVVGTVDQPWLTALALALVAVTVLVFWVVPLALRIVDGFAAGYRGETR
jgi:hypothetical protein